MGDWDEGIGWKLYADAFKEASVVEKGIMIVLPLVGGIALQFFDNDIITIRYLGLWRLIGGFTEDFRPHQNEMYLLVIPSHTLWNIVDIRL